MGLLVIPSLPVEGGALTVRLDGGPFAQPAPQLTLEVEGNRIIATVSGDDFAYPDLPPIPAVQATIRAPHAGMYVLVHRACGGNPPPPQPGCSEVSQQTIEIAIAHAAPALAPWGLGLLLLCVAALAAQRIERALTAFERLRV
jgi:hypothetical protein